MFVWKENALSAFSFGVCGWWVVVYMYCYVTSGNMRAIVHNIIHWPTSDSSGIIMLFIITG